MNETKLTREQRLAKALRDNLRKRKAPAGKPEETSQPLDKREV